MMGSDQRVWPSEQTNWAKDNNNNNLLFTRRKIALKYDLMLACLLIYRSCRDHDKKYANSKTGLTITDC